MPRYELKRRKALKPSPHYQLKRTEISKVGKKGKKNAKEDRKDRKVAHERTQRVCEYCEQQRAVQVHHVLRKSHYEEFRHVTELQVDLCRECHEKAEFLIFNLENFERIRPEVFAQEEYGLQSKLDMARSRVAGVDRAEA